MSVFHSFAAKIKTLNNSETFSILLLLFFYQIYKGFLKLRTLINRFIDYVMLQPSCIYNFATCQIFRNFTYNFFEVRV